MKTLPPVRDTAASVRIAIAMAMGLAMLAALPVRSQDQSAGAAGPAAQPPTTPEQDLKALQGTWERALATGRGNVRVGAGNDDAGEADAEDAGRGAAKAVKEIGHNRETVTYLNDAGQPVYATTANFKLETAGRVKLYTYSNLKVTQGKADAGGDAPAAAVSYIYRVSGDLYHEAHGLLVDSPAGSKPTVVTWKRAK